MNQFPPSVPRKHVFFFFLLLTHISFAQAPTIQWEKTLGGNNSDGIIAAFENSDGSYFVGGTSNSGLSGNKTVATKGGSDFWVLKLDASGNVLWQKSIGGSADERLGAAQVTQDGGYILGGSSSSDISGDKTESSQGQNDFWIVKLDAAGNIEWQNTIGGSGFEELNDLYATPDGGYIAGGRSTSGISGDKTENGQGSWDFWVVKLDAMGSIQWQNNIGSNGVEEIRSLQPAADGGYILAGTSNGDAQGDKTENSQGDNDFWVVKLDAVGNIQWQNTIGGSDADFVENVQQTSDGGFMLGGWTFSEISGDKTEPSRGDADYWLVKLDATGYIQWQKTLGGSDGDYLYSVKQTTEGNYILSGWSRSDISGDKTEPSRGSGDFWLLKLTSSGNILWQASIGGSFDDVLLYSESTADNGFILGGYSDSNTSGDKTQNCFGDFDYWVVKLKPEISGTYTRPDFSPILLNSANPFGASLQFSLTTPLAQDLTVRFYNNAGALVAVHPWPKSVQKLDLPTGNWRPGLYFAQVRNAAGAVIYAEKLVKGE